MTSEALRASALKKIGWETKEGKQEQGLKSSLTVSRGTKGSSDNPWGRELGHERNQGKMPSVEMAVENRAGFS